MNRNVALTLVVIVLVIGAVLYFRGTSETPTDGVPAKPSTTSTDRGSTGEPVGAVSEAQQLPGVVYDDDGIAIAGVEQRPGNAPPLNIDNIIKYHENHVFVSNSARDTFTVPLPGDPEWADYLEFRRAFPSMNDNSPGYALAYDPEWRSVVRGYREVPDPGMDLFGGADTIREVVEQVLTEISDKNELGLVDLAIRKEEFEVICWPSFPQARPYTLTEWSDAWRFQYANIVSGMKEGIEEAGGVPLALESLAYDEIEDFQHFKLYNGLKVRAKNPETGDVYDFEWLNSIIERNGVFKVYMYKN